MLNAGMSRLQRVTTRPQKGMQRISAEPICDRLAHPLSRSRSRRRLSRRGVVRSYRLRIGPALIVSILLIPATALSQDALAEPDNAAADVDFDAAGYVAWFRGNRGDVGGDTFRDWYTAPRLSIGVGRYWTEHLKTEAELAITGRGTLVSFEDLHGEPFVSC